MIWRLFYIFVSMIGGEYLYKDKYKKQPCDEGVDWPNSLGEFREAVIFFFVWHYQLTILIHSGHRSRPFSSNLPIKFPCKLLGGPIDQQLKDPWYEKKDWSADKKNHNKSIISWVCQFVHKVVSEILHKPVDKQIVNQIQSEWYLGQKLDGPWSEDPTKHIWCESKKDCRDGCNIPHELHR